MTATISSYFRETVARFWQIMGWEAEEVEAMTPQRAEDEIDRTSALREWELPSGKVKIIRHRNSYQFVFYSAHTQERITNLPVKPNIIAEEIALREFYRRLGAIKGVYLTIESQNKYLLNLILPGLLQHSRMDKSVELDESNWCVTLIKAKGARHAEMIVEGVDKIGETWAAMIHLVGDGKVKMLDMTNKTIEYSSRAEVISITAKQGRRLIEAICEDAAISFDPEDPKSRQEPETKDKTIPFSLLGNKSLLTAMERQITQIEKHNCTTYLLTKLKELDIQDWNPNTVTIFTDPNNYIYQQPAGESPPVYDEPAFWATPQDRRMNQPEDSDELATVIKTGCYSIKTVKMCEQPASNRGRKTRLEN